MPPRTATSPTSRSSPACAPSVSCPRPVRATLSVMRKGDRLGRTMQWRGKICPDGVGGTAELAAFDYWDVDEGGYPVFDENDGRNGLLY